MSPVDKIALFSGLSAAELKLIKSCLREKTVKKREILLTEGGGCNTLFIVQSGRIKLCRTTPAGREQILETLGPGETCVCNPGVSEWNCIATAQAVTASKVWILHRDDYVRLIQANPGLSRALNHLFAAKLRCFSSLIEEVSLKDTRKRIVKLLLDMLDSRPPQTSGHVLFIPFTREEFAQRIGVARETAARHLHQLKRRGFIEIKRREIMILNLPGLQKLLS